MWGIFMTLSLLQPKQLSAKKIEVKDEDMPNFIFEIVLTPLLALAAGYVIKFWFM
jgi:hypothetical protein